MKIKMISSEDKEEWLKETYDYLQKLKKDKYGDVRLDYIVLYELHKEEHKEIERLNNVINELEKALKSHQYIKVNAHYGEYYVEIDEVLNFIKKLKEGK